MRFLSTDCDRIVGRQLLAYLDDVVLRCYIITVPVDAFNRRFSLRLTEYFMNELYRMQRRFFDILKCNGETSISWSTLY